MSKIHLRYGTPMGTGVWYVIACGRGTGRFTDTLTRVTCGRCKRTRYYRQRKDLQQCVRCKVSMIPGAHIGLEVTRRTCDACEDARKLRIGLIAGAIPDRVVEA